MAEAGMPATAEMQPQRPAMRLRDRLGKWARETFTPTGRAEVMAQKYADRIVAAIPEDKRGEAMELLERRRPELVEAYMGQAKGSLVRDAVIGAAAVGTVTAAVIFRKPLAEQAGKVFVWAKAKTPDRVKNPIAAVAGKAGEVAGGMRNRVDRVMAAMGRLFHRGGKAAEAAAPAAPPRKWLEVLSGAIKLDDLDALDRAAPVTKDFFDNALRGKAIFAGSELQNIQGEAFVHDFLHLAEKFGRWVPMVFAKDTKPYGFGDDHEGMGGLVKQGLVTVKELTDGKTLFIPTKQFVDFVNRHVARAGGA